MNRSLLQKGLLIALMLFVTVSQPFAAPDKAQPGQNTGDGFGFAAMQERILNICKEKLGVTDEEWAVLEPRLMKVRKLSQNIQTMTTMTQWKVFQPRLKEMEEQGQDGNPMAGMRRMFIDRIRTELEAQAQRAGEEQNGFRQALTELQETLEKPAPSTTEIKVKMAALRGAKEKARQDLAQAQKELRELLTVKQEALLLMLGVLE
jgi:chromosome segregation ATPase